MNDAEQVDDLDTLAADVSRLARSIDYRPTRLRLIRERLLTWVASRDEDQADALYVAYSMGAAARATPVQQSPTEVSP